MRRFISAPLVANLKSARIASGKYVQVTARNSSTELTKEEKEAGLKKVEAYRRHIMKSRKNFYQI